VQRQRERLTVARCSVGPAAAIQAAATCTRDYATSIHRIDYEYVNDSQGKPWLTLAIRAHQRTQRAITCFAKCLPLRYAVDDDVRDLKPGERMFSPRGPVHAFSNPHGHPGSGAGHSHSGRRRAIFSRSRSSRQRAGRPQPGENGKHYAWATHS